MPLTRLRVTNLLDSDFKNSCRVTTSTNIANLSAGAPSTVDSIGLTVSDRVLVQGQTTASQNGIYKVVTVGTGSNGSWVRDSDAAITGSMSPGTLVYVEEGSTNGAKFYYIISIGAITVGTTAILFNQFTSGNVSGGTVAGLNTQLQFNDGGAFGGSSGLVYYKANSALIVGGNLNAANLTVTSGIYRKSLMVFI